MTSQGKCPVVHGSNTESGNTPMSWWPKSLNFGILRVAIVLLMVAVARVLEICVLPHLILGLTMAILIKHADSYGPSKRNTVIK